MRTTFRHAAVAAALYLPVGAAADGQVGRYLTVAPVAPIEQRFPLTEIGAVNIPADVVSIRDAIAHVLAGTGYQLAPRDVLDPESFDMLAAPVAENQRAMTGVSKLNALAALAGPGFEVVVDPLSRRVAIDVCLHRPTTLRTTANVEGEE